MASILPASVARSIAEGAAVLASRGPAVPGRLSGLAERRRMAARHLRRVYGEEIGAWRMARLVDEAFGSYARYWAETFQLPSLPAERILAGMDYDHFDYIQGGLDAGRGVILALPHLGGWEWAGTQLALTGHPISVVVERLQPPDLFDWFVSLREQLGMRVISVGPGAAARCAQALADNHILCLLSDRVVGTQSTVDVEFFGEVTQLPAGPATLALRTGATLLPCAVPFARLGPRANPGTTDDEAPIELDTSWRSDHHVGVVRPALELGRRGRFREDVQALTQGLAEQFEGLIRLAPTQWHLMQPNWPSDLGPVTK